MSGYDDLGGYYDRAGQPMGMLAWAQSFEDREGAIIGRTEIGESQVSTVWLGIDHSFGDGPPLIFETMVFGGPLNEHQWRYSTEDEARKGHDEACELVRAAG